MFDRFIFSFCFSRHWSDIASWMWKWAEEIWLMNSTPESIWNSKASPNVGFRGDIQKGCVWQSDAIQLIIEHFRLYSALQVCSPVLPLVGQWLRRNVIGAVLSAPNHISFPLACWMYQARGEEPVHQISLSYYQIIFFLITTHLLECFS